MDGDERLIGALGRLKDVPADGLDQPEPADGLGLRETDLDGLGIRFGALPLGALGLGAELNDRVVAPPRFVTDGLEGICGEAGALEGALLVLDGELARLELSRPRDWP